MILSNHMKIGAIIQARMSSTRLPGKTLLPISSKPMLQYVIERVAHSQQLDQFLVATSTEASDDAIEKFCTTMQVDCFRGNLSDVAHRFLTASQQYGWEAVVRICGDSPLIDPRLIDQAVEIFLSGEYDLVTNTLERTFPKGQSVEVIRMSTFRDAHPQFETPGEREHVTEYFYTNNDQFRIHNFVSGHNSGTLQLSVDTPDDFQTVETIIRSMQRPHWEYGWEEIVKKLL